MGLGDYPRDSGTTLWKLLPEIEFLIGYQEACIRMFTAVLYVKANNWKKLKGASTGEWIDKLNLYTRALYRREN